MLEISKFYFFHSLALSFFNGVAVVRVFSSCTQCCKPQNFAFALSKSVVYVELSLPSPRPTWQISRLAFAFSQA